MLLPPIEPRAHRRKNARGFTMIELMVTIAVLAILATVAAPNFSSTMERWRVRNASEDFKSSFYFARSEAIKRGGDVEMQPLDVGNWNSGWKIVDTRADEDLKEVITPPKIAITSSSSEIKFNRWGMVSGTWPSFTFYPEGKDATTPATRKVVASSGGRIRVEY